MDRRVVGLLVGMAIGGVGHAAPAELAVAQPQPQPQPAPADAGSGFRLEGKPAVDDVFGDASDYRRTIDRFIDLATQMQAMRDEFARSVQSALSGLSAHAADKKSTDKRPATTKKASRCPIDAVAAPYAKAHHLGVEYLRVGRELTRHYDQVKEFDRLGESIGLTPDYRWKVKRVLQQYATLLTDYREMKVAFHDQLVDELKYAGCDLQELLNKGDPQGQGGYGRCVATAGTAGRAWRAGGEERPPTARHGAAAEPAEPSACRRSSRSCCRSTRRRRIRRSPKPARACCSTSTTPSASAARPSYLDGKKIGEVPAATRVGFQATPGPHDLCLLDPTKKECGAPGTVRRSYLHEGWTISLRCE